MPASPISKTIEKIEAEPMHPTEWKVRKELLRITDDIPEDDYLAQAEGWNQISLFAMDRRNELVRLFAK